jgi:chlorophyllase
MLRRMNRTLVSLMILAGCGGEPEATSGGTSSGESSTGAAVSSSGGEIPTSAGTGSEGPQDTGLATTGGPAETTTTATTATTTTAGSTGGPEDTGDESTTGSGDELYDPNLDGPWEIAEIEGLIKVGSVDVAIDCFYPTGGPTAGPYPVVVVAHGFQLPPTQYTQYVRRLATHGYVALTADFKAELFGADHVANAQQVLGGIDWAADEPTLAGLADTNNVGLTGHSLGGKLAIHGAVLDERVRASVTLDPVDGSQMCDQVKCPDISAMLPIDKPLGFVGETLDGSGGFMPCAPQDNNFLTFFAAASGPALAVTVNGANHMSFLDDVDSCGFTCNFCQMPTLDNDTVNALARAYVVAFYGRYLKGEAGYDTYLIGAAAQERYIEPGLVDVQVK